jgi:cytochrome c-type biogenesis protein CcmE
MAVSGVSGTSEERRLNATQGSVELPDGFERGRSRLPLVLAGILAFSMFAGLGFTMLSRSVVYYRTPTEAMRAPGMHVRLSGTVVNGSISNDVAAGTVAFEVTDGRTTVPVLFKGVAPDALRDGGEAVAEGALGSDGLFMAQRLFARCPSKFQTATPGP